MGLSSENIKNKIEFYNSIGMKEILLKSPKYFMQSVELSYARYMFFREKNDIIDSSNYIKLFTSNKRFEKQFGVKNEELLEKYNYTKYFESKNTSTHIESLARVAQNVSLDDAYKGEEFLNAIEKSKIIEEREGIHKDEER